MAKTSLPDSKLVNTSAGFKDMYIVAAEAVLHTHGPEGEHEHENVAFTTWLDPVLAIEQARAIRDALGRAYLPGSEADLQQGFAGPGDGTWTELDVRLEAWAGGIAGQPASARIASRCTSTWPGATTLTSRSVHFEPDGVPTAGGWRDLVARARCKATPRTGCYGRPLRWTRHASAWPADYGVGSVVFDPSGNRPASGDYIST